MPLPAGYALNAFGFVFETSSGQGYGPYKWTPLGGIQHMGGDTLAGIIPADLQKGTHGLWYKTSDGSGPYFVSAIEVRGLLTFMNE